MVKKRVPQSSTQQIEVFSKKRKKEESVPETTQTGDRPSAIQESLEAAGVTVGRKTQRDRLLGLLSRHVIKKMPRMSGRLVPDITRKRSDKNTPFEEIPDVEIPSQPSGDGPNFSLFANSDLVEMIRGVGVDAADFDRTNLIKTCKTYSELIVIPDRLQKFIFENSTPSEPKEKSSRDNSQQPAAGPSVPSVQSLKTTRSNKTRVRLTKRRSPKPKKYSGKGKLKASESDDYDPSISDSNNSNTSDPDSSQASDEEIISRKTSKPKGTKSSKSNFTSGKEDPGPTSQDESECLNPENPSKNESDKLETGSAEWLLQKIYKLEAHNARTDRRLEAMSERFEMMTDVINKQIGTRSPKTSGTKPRGGETSARIRFHIETMFGQKEHEKNLPDPATETERSTWMCDIEPASINIDQDAPPSQNSPFQPVDPCFPYPNGPGHKDSTPQQLSIIWNMMQAVGVSSFRPDFSEPPQSQPNKWLWDLALKIFIKLVECGEYTGVPLQNDNRDFIKKCLYTHALSLKKRYQNENWEEERRKTTNNEVRRTARLRYLRRLREKIVLTHQALWPLSKIITVACSDDETDYEPTSSTEAQQGPGRPCRVRNLEWRSKELEHICILLDGSKVKNDSSTPGKNKSPKQSGRPNRPRSRGEDRPVTHTSVPPGLPIDCYSKRWLQSLSPLERSELGISSKAILKDLLPIVERL
ncbi:uncharacterized protein MELLADRAFT_86952 [Melampsora larici-populina 98AG31]|uniref:Uncharacterized protein n=1 Tax=Melampsora larici-populina (strain 98AG31 / pathotype 3-4-7) TaxID=747676 RepID=F4R3Z4_MELLP|nr:uncharacterized protein MELLADRAFT_86952 [Melampsora larici-populina 98AG31]EGG12708.1 hypothetical protein MELLADRAFT_86952 [Melampsora larici-populina 98AG31]